MRDDLQRCKDMLLAIDKIEQQCHGLHEGDADELLNVWILHHIQIIGEAAYKTSEHFKTKHPDIAWSKIIGTRHVLVHDYFQTNSHILWQTVENDLPLLKQQLIQIISN
ncbi:MAG: DUF86 domain-containing protein [Anaerolineae bacterium]|nr:DUF86 domain-containing protein [Anaerolineae bacterium]